MKFQVEATLSLEGDSYVMARRLEAGPFSISPNSRLGGVPLKQLLEIPRKLVKPGRRLEDVFVFALEEPGALARFQKADVVELVP